MTTVIWKRRLSSLVVGTAMTLLSASGTAGLASADDREYLKAIPCISGPDTGVLHNDCT